MQKIFRASQIREGLFLFFSFFGWLFCNILGRLSFVPYAFSVLLYPIFFMGLVLLLFQPDREKKILAAAMLLVVVRMVADFVAKAQGRT
ncbi:hypothetical protein C823_002358 [Eubacterium plexicaudatum ASF492]|uniref:Uncharacterized protein n=1 Tax=Eubacterium plexicaudatum ASF492 TaxID=1235802 RepID=N2BM72_9FIRM|nr:hypothetical protein C823_002358 [Eubacterium plexicaudatum ASF492]